MQILGLLLLFIPFLPTTTPTRRGSHVPGARSHLSRHVFSKIKARAQLKDLPKVVFETKKNSPPVDYLDHQPMNQDKDKDRKQHHWNQLIQHIENRHRDSTRQLFKKIKTDLIQTIQTLVSPFSFASSWFSKLRFIIMLSQDEDLLEVRKRERREQKNDQPTTIELDKKVRGKH